MDESVVWEIVRYREDMGSVSTGQTLGGDGRWRGYYGELSLRKPNLEN